MNEDQGENMSFKVSPTEAKTTSSEQIHRNQHQLMAILYDQIMPSDNMLLDNTNTQWAGSQHEYSQNSLVHFSEEASESIGTQEAIENMPGTQTEDKKDLDEVGPLLKKEVIHVKTGSDCYDNKDYTDSVSSHSSTRPLLGITKSLQNIAKEAELPTPVIGLITHPGFMSSHQDLSSTTNISFACSKALKYLQDERVASSLRLSGSCKELANKSPEDGTELSDLDHNILPSGRHKRSLISLSICLTMVFSSCGTLRNLQTSINPEDGIGIKCQLMSFVGFIFGSLISPFLVQKLSPHRSLLLSLAVHFLYIIVHFYPAMWLVLPISFFLGISAAVLWNAMSTYVTFLAKGSSEKKGDNYENTLTRYFGIFYLIVQLNMIIGNLIASLIFTYVNPIHESSNSTEILGVALANFSSQNLSLYSESNTMPTVIQSVEQFHLNSSSDFNLCGASFRHHYIVDSEVTTASLAAKYVLYSVFIGFMIIAFVINIFMLEPLNRNLFSSDMTMGMVKTQFISLGRFLKNRKFLLLCPFLLYSLMEYSFLSGEITMAFVTCPLGVHMVGYALICSGVAGSASSYLSGWLCRFLGRKVLIGIAVVCNLGLLVLMALWRPTSDSPIVIFALVSLWGMADGIWQTQTNSVIGVMFRDQFEEAFTGMRLVQGLGPAIGFAYAQGLSMGMKVYILASVCVVAMAGYLLAERIFKVEQSNSDVTSSKPQQV